MASPPESDAISDHDTIQMGSSSDEDWELQGTGEDTSGGRSSLQYSSTCSQSIMEECIRHPALTILRRGPVFGIDRAA